LGPDAEESVHFAPLPDAETELIDADLERKVAAMRVVIECARLLRERRGVAVKVIFRGKKNLIYI
jgi:isoleucyl-tRNA synthetase